MGRQQWWISAKDFEHFNIVRYLAKWVLVAMPVALSVGSLVALFLWLLEKATAIRAQNPWLIFLLPLAGVFIYFLYSKYGKGSEAGNNLIIDEIHEPAGGVPLRMTPLVLSTTIITHLFGGSAGREGTAVQMGGSIAGRLARWFRLGSEDTRLILITGIAAGIGAVFGTPLAGAIFSHEVLTIGKIDHKALLPAFIASYFAHLVCSAWGISYTHYQISSLAQNEGVLGFLRVDHLLLLKVVFAGMCFGLAGYLFSEVLHLLKHILQEVKVKWLIPVLGGLAIIALTFLLDTRDYLGIGVGGHGSRVSITAAFQSGGADALSWLWKLLFTAITLSTGFKGGEVTPLFFMGATLGNAMARLTDAPVDLMAGLGFVAVFAGATNTPVACLIMGVELFGAEHILYLAFACFTAYYFSGHSGIYHAQRIETSKIGRPHTAGVVTLRSVSSARAGKMQKWLKKRR